jgi:hypothetical protein
MWIVRKRRLLSDAQMIDAWDGIDGHLQVDVQVAAEVRGVRRDWTGACCGWNPRYVVVNCHCVSNHVRELQHALVTRVHIGDIVGVVRVRDGIRGQHHRDEDRGGRRSRRRWRWGKGHWVGWRL